MENLFLPCTRLHDLIDNQDDFDEDLRDNLHSIEERNLNVSIEEFLSAERAFTYADLYGMVGNKDTVATVAWLTPHAAVAGGGGRAVNFWNQLDEDMCCFCFSADDKEIFAMARSTEHLLEICDIVLRVLAVSVVHSVKLFNNGSTHDRSINAPSLAYLMEQCHSLKVLSLKGLGMDENHCRVLGAYSRPDLEIVLDYCKITSAGASALVEVLGRNQGPTKLDQCEIDNFVLANGLCGNRRLKSLRPRFSSYLEANREVLAIAGGLQENKGLVEFDLTHSYCVIDEAWGAICDSLETHPTLEVLDLLGAFRDVVPVPGVQKSRIQAMLQMLKENISIHTIRLQSEYSQHELFRGSVVPYLETNRLRPRLLAIQQTRPIAYRAMVLGRALLAVRNDPNRFWMILSGNAEVAFPSSTTTIAPAANFPTPGTAAATSTVSGSLPTAAADATTATSAATPANASASDAVATTVAANVAAPSAGQKRKTRP
jgi:hypothetical protein